jgi:hypothetical protein
MHGNERIMLVEGAGDRESPQKISQRHVAHLSSKECTFLVKDKCFRLWEMGDHIGDRMRSLGLSFIDGGTDH